MRRTASLMRTAIVLRRDEEEKNRRELEQQQHERERAELRKQIEAEEAKVAQLDQWAKGWEEAERLRRFISAYAEKAQTWPTDSQPKTSRGSSGRSGRQIGTIHSSKISRFRSWIGNTSYVGGEHDGHQLVIETFS
jgi:hypothetical protein